MEKIILVIPRDIVVAEPLVYPPIGFLYIAAVLEEAGFGVVIYDMREEKNKIENIPESKIYCFTSSTPQIKEVIGYSRYVKFSYNNPFIVLGGHYASWQSKQVADKFDAVVIGEGETVIVDIIKNRKKGIFDGFTFSKKQNLDDIPFPARHLLPKERIVNNFLMNGQGFDADESNATTLICSRGCPNRCRFCANLPQKVRYRSAGNVVKEIEFLIKEYNCRSYKFMDDNIVSNKEFLRNLCNGLSELNINFRCLARSDMLDEESCELLKKAGAKEIALGIETLDDKILKAMNKRETVADHMRAIKLIKKYEIDLRVYFMVGFPGETQETIDNIKKFVLDIKPEKWTTSMFIPYPGSSIFKHPEKYGYDLFEKDLDKYYQLYPTVPPYNTTTSTSEQITFYHRDLVKFLDDYKNGKINGDKL